MTRTKSIYLALLAVLLSPMAANADMIIEYSDFGSDLLLEWSGSLNITGAAGSSFPGYTAIGNQSGSVSPVFYSAPAHYYWQSAFGVSASAPSFWGATVGWDPTGNSSTGDHFMFRYNANANSVDFWGDIGGYTAGTNISGTLTAGGYSIASSGIVDWSVDLGADIGSIYIRAKSVPVPEPGTLALFGIGLLGMGLARRRKKV